ncbi:phage portal protein [Streptomyces sp. TRM72054]|uniref:phage portal protein n=1 Tax=Streptomyces sp. TRM72054 TaxID=2870562 RepID=UPI001C8B7603|nr:phage portal protein [Streptomyces sp. TRM72054]MBX9392244.1 phage portal protein [Streptomyces sp. TRM72054]
MSVCTTCHQPGIKEHHDCPGIGEIQLTRQRGRGVIVESAPPRALIGLHVIRDLAWPANIAGVGDPDLVNIADQVLYRVVGYAPESAALVVERVEDWRKPGVLTFDRKLTEDEMEQFRAEWRRRHGGQAREILRHDEEQPGA